MVYPTYQSLTPSPRPRHRLPPLLDQAINIPLYPTIPPALPLALVMLLERRLTPRRLVLLAEGGRRMSQSSRPKLRLPQVDQEAVEVEVGVGSQLSTFRVS